MEQPDRWKSWFYIRLCSSLGEIFVASVTRLVTRGGFFQAFAAHVHHRSARRWIDALPENCRCVFCGFTQHGFLRLANNPKAFPQIAATQVEAWKLYDTFVSNPRNEFAAEPPMLETI